MTETVPARQVSDEKTTEVTSLDVDHSDQSSPSVDISPMQYRKLIWKLDLHLLPPLFALWFVSLIDRINIGSANIFGIQKDLKMNPKSNDFNIALVIVLVGLITCEVPSNWLLKKTSPSKVLALESFVLAIFTIGQGLVTNFSGLLAMRFFIGVCEAGLIPGSVFLLAQYYPRYELQWRLSMLMVGNAVATAFGGLLAFSIAGIKASNGYSPWRWIFIIEGCITAGVTIFVYPFMSDWPATAKWLSDSERAILSDKMKGDLDIGTITVLNPRNIKRIAFDWKIYVCATLTCCTTVTVYSVAIFAPTIINQFSVGQSPRHVQALVIPIFVAASFGCLVSAYLSDKLKHRASFAFFGYCLTIVGLVILLNQKHVPMNVKYGGLYFLAVGSYISLPLLWTMLINNVLGSYKMGYASAMQVGLGNFGGLASALIFQGKMAPFFTTGYSVALGMTVLAAVLVPVYTAALWWENKQRADGKRDHTLIGEDKDSLGDEHPRFKFGY